MTPFPGWTHGTPPCCSGNHPTTPSPGSWYIYGQLVHMVYIVRIARAVFTVLGRHVRHKLIVPIIYMVFMVHIIPIVHMVTLCHGPCKTVHMVRRGTPPCYIRIQSLLHIYIFVSEWRRQCQSQTTWDNPQHFQTMHQGPACAKGKDTICHKVWRLSPE